ncbi:MAG: hypothetical protein FWG27_08430 [Treponema sp.]|nr:hypothetical protein [Treponema sp.]
MIMLGYRFCFFSALFTLLGTGVFAQSLESLLPEDLIKQLVQSGTVNRERFDTAELRMVPRYPALERLLDAKRAGLNPNISIESLQLYKKPSSGNWTAEEKSDLCNGIFAISTLKGLEYFSKSRNKMRTLYETSTVIDGPDTKNPRPDPSYRTPPAELSVFVRQKDLTFGDNVYQFTFYADETAFIIFQENITTLSYGPVPVVDKNKLRSVVAIIDCGPYLLIYTASLAKASMLPGMKQRAGESISNRAVALLSWFTQKADRAFGKNSR